MREIGEAGPEWFKRHCCTEYTEYVEYTEYAEEVYKKIRDNIFQFLLDKRVRYGILRKEIENVIVLVMFALVIQIIIDGILRKEDRRRKVYTDEAYIGSIAALMKRNMGVKISMNRTYLTIHIKDLRKMKVKTLHECMIVDVEHGMESRVIVFYEIILNRRPGAELFDTIQGKANNGDGIIHDKA